MLVTILFVHIYDMDPSIKPWIILKENMSVYNSCISLSVNFISDSTSFIYFKFFAWTENVGPEIAFDHSGH